MLLILLQYVEHAYERVSDIAKVLAYKKRRGICKDRI